MSLRKKARRLLPFRYDVLHPDQQDDLGNGVELPEGFFPTNPSFVDTEVGRLHVVRGVNYRIDPGSMRTRFTHGDAHKSLNRFFLSDKQGTRLLPSLDAGLVDAEDIRLFSHAGAVWCAFSQPDGTGACHMALARLDLTGKPVKHIPLPSPLGLRQEKNWSPFSHNGAIHFIYSFAPLIVLRYDIQRDELKFVDPAMASIHPGRLDFLIGGSGSCIEEGGDRIFLVHRRSARLPRLHKIYLHACVRIQDLTRIHFGPHFVIGRPEVQFAAAFVREEHQLAIGFGRRDNEAWIARFEAAPFIDHMVPAAGTGL